MSKRKGQKNRNNDLPKHFA